jgi:murein hydrolase activator
MMYGKRFLVMAALLGTIIIFVSITFAQSDDLVDQKKELEKIRRDIETSQKNLDSLRNAEKKVLNDISDYEQRATANETVLRRLNKQLKAIRGDIQDSRTRLEDSQARLGSSRNRYIGNLKYYYSGIRWGDITQKNEILMEKGAYLRLRYLRILAAYDKIQLSRSSEYLKEAEKEYEDLISREKTVGEVQKKKKSEYTIVASQKQKRERDLSRLRRKKDSETERLEALSDAARMMEEVVARLEAARKKREKAAEPGEFKYATGNFASYKGKLSAPLTGTITKGFGWSTDPVTKLKSFSPGIEIVGKKKSTVAAVADGVVAYVGNLRGYGNFVIIEHEDGYYSTYAGIDILSAEQGQRISRNEKLGIINSGNLKFELRRGKESLDPVEWIRIDSFR